MKSAGRLTIGVNTMDAMQAAAETAAPSGTTLKRRLQGRHIAMIAIGIMVYFVVTGLGEMAALMPVSGSFTIYGEKYVDEGFGVALGWTYWYSWAVTIAIELVAAQIVMRYWFPSVPGVWWGATRPPRGTGRRTDPACDPTGARTFFGTCRAVTCPAPDSAGRSPCR